MILSMWVAVVGFWNTVPLPAFSVNSPDDSLVLAGRTRFLPKNRRKSFRAYSYLKSACNSSRMKFLKNKELKAACFDILTKNTGVGEISNQLPFRPASRQHGPQAFRQRSSQNSIRVLPRYSPTRLFRAATQGSRTTRRFLLVPSLHRLLFTDRRSRESFPLRCRPILGKPRPFNTLSPLLQKHRGTGAAFELAMTAPARKLANGRRRFFAGTVNCKLWTLGFFQGPQ